jgi:cysteine desulfurase
LDAALYRIGSDFRKRVRHKLSQRLYLDHAATTPMVLGAREAMRAAIARWANPSSPHAEGRAARAMLEDARKRIASALDWNGEVILTSGATEAIRIALTRAKCDARIVSAVEHEAVHRVAGDAFLLPVQQDGTVLPDALIGRLGALGAKAPLVAVQAVNSETGVCQAFDQLSPIVRKAGGLLFADCAQSAGKATLPNADLIAISAHKFGGPPGVGALLVKDLGLLEPSGGQEKGYRAGTENMPGAVAMAAALEAGRGWVDRAADLRSHLDGAIEAAGGEVVARRAPRLATIASYRMPGVGGSAQLIQLDLAGIAVSAGSACSSGTLKTSHVLSAMGWGDKEAGEVIRVSFGPETSRADIYRFVEAWKRISDSARSRAA